MREGLHEWAVLTAILVACAVAVSREYGPEIRAAFGVAAIERGGAALAPHRAPALPAPAPAAPGPVPRAPP